MNYSLDFETHKSLLKKIFNKEVSLFTGAGFSLGATIKGGKILSTGDLKRDMLKNLMDYEESIINRTIERKTFQEICQLCITHITEEEFNNYLVRKFVYCTPTDFHYKYASIPWKEIYTLNIDDIIETIYRDTDIELQVFNTHIKPTDYNGDNILKYYKLHGDVNNKREGFVFSSTQYLNKLNVGETFYNHTKFSEIIYNDTLCIIGSSINETDLELHIQKFRKGLSGQLPKEKIYYISRSIYEEDVALLESKNIICIQETAESFIEKLIEYAKTNLLIKHENSKNTPLKIVKKIDFNTKINNLGFTVQANLDKSEKNKKTYKAIDFYTGFEPTWNDIIHESDALLLNTEALIKDISQNSLFKIYLILGKAGNGKTTSLKRIIYNFSTNSDYLVLDYNDTTYIDDSHAYKLGEELKKQKKKIIITFDNGAWAFNFISHLYKHLKFDVDISIIVTSRIPEYYREMRNINDLKTQISNYDEIICETNAERIINKLEEQSYLGKLAQHKTMEKRIKSFIRLNNNHNDLFSCLIQSVEGDGHYNKLESIIENNMKKKENALFLIVLTIFDNFGTFSLSLQLFLNIFQNEISDLKTIVQDCSDLLNQIDIKDYKTLNQKIRLRGSFVSDKILENYNSFFSHDEILNISKQILIFISSNYNTQFKNGKNFYTEITHSLLVSKRYQKTFGIKNREKFNSFYHSLINNFNENSDFWLQYAKMEMKLGDLKSAKVHLEQAESLNPFSIKIKHAIGQWYMFKSITYRNYEQAISEFKKGEEIMLGQGTSNDAYPIHSLIDGFMAFHRTFQFKLNKSQVKDYFKLIKDSLVRLNNHSLLLIIWKKYYLFLEENHVAHFVNLSMDDLHLMKKIDLNRDADEQYLQYIDN